jgi:hypothetical protein
MASISSAKKVGQIRNQQKVHGKPEDGGGTLMDFEESSLLGCDAT